MACATGAAREVALVGGGRFEIEVGAVRRTLRLVATWRAEEELLRRQVSRLVVTDISTAQEVLGRLGRLDRIDLRLPSRTVESEIDVEALAASLPDGVTLRATDERRRSFDAMTRAFRLNLQALGLLALVVGVFLIHQTITLSVLARRSLWGRLRAMGVRRREILRALQQTARHELVES